MTTLVSAKGVGKRYFIGSNPLGTLSLRDRITAMFRKRTEPDLREFWALRDLDFELHRGEVLGIIGRNGAGKSTLLKLVSEITEPTEGEIHLFGRVASLLEVGVGFHPELSGRENVFLNGAILGMTRAEIRRKFDEIVAFAEIEKFIDTPVKRYSSGMYVRLAFAVAAHLEPDVLIVDEVLAVGDAAFQRKCLGKMEDVASADRGVIVVSHNMSIVTQLCKKVIWLDGGRLRDAGPTSRVVSSYLSQGLTNSASWQPAQAASDVFSYSEVRLEHRDGDAAFAANEPIEIVLDFNVIGKIVPGRLSVKVSRDDGLTILTSSSNDLQPTQNMPWHSGEQRLRVCIPANLLAPAKYYVTVSEPLEVGNVLHENILSFTVTDQNSLVARDQREGVIALPLQWLQEPR